MERTVPKTGGEEIQLYMRTYYSLLRSSHTVQIETLAESHIAMASSLHVNADSMEPDVSALIYSALRLPQCMAQTDEVLIGQIERSFIDAGYRDIPRWQRVYAPGRRRRMHFDGQSRLVVYVVSRSDIDDLVPMLTAYQIEWNKIHTHLQSATAQEFLNARRDDTQSLSEAEVLHLAQILRMPSADLRRLEIVWKEEFINTLWQISQRRKDMGMRLISGSMADYRRATASWWQELLDAVNDAGVNPERQPIYFVSSNTHSIINLLIGFARRHEESLIQYVHSINHEALLAEYESIQTTPNKSLENFLYFVQGKYMHEVVPDAEERLRRDERSVGVFRVPNRYGFEIEPQLIELGKLHQQWIDPRLQDVSLDFALLRRSDALILNIDYPLGMAAYEILSRITERSSRLQGIYIMGKAATLNGRIGDIMIPNLVHDEHSQNTYLFNNCFSALDVKPYMSFGNVLDNQKAVTALGTFLQNPGYMSVFYREGYTDIEMEGGPYLSAVYEAFRPKRHPQDEIVNLYGIPFDMGFLHYASDTPMKKGQNLGAGSLSYTGVEPTYATAIAILRRILSREMQRLLANNSQSSAEAEFTRSTVRGKSNAQE